MGTGLRIPGFCQETGVGDTRTGVGRIDGEALGVHIQGTRDLPGGVERLGQLGQPRYAAAMRFGGDLVPGIVEHGRRLSGFPQSTQGVPGRNLLLERGGGIRQGGERGLLLARIGQRLGQPGAAQGGRPGVDRLPACLQPGNGVARLPGCLGHLVGDLGGRVGGRVPGILQRPDGIWGAALQPQAEGAAHHVRQRIGAQVGSLRLVVVQTLAEGARQGDLSAVCQRLEEADVEIGDRK